jgi:hypothetical protein
MFLKGFYGRMAALAEAGPKYFLVMDYLLVMNY